MAKPDSGYARPQFIELSGFRLELKYAHTPYCLRSLTASRRPHVGVPDRVILRVVDRRLTVSSGEDSWVDPDTPMWSSFCVRLGPPRVGVTQFELRAHGGADVYARGVMTLQTMQMFPNQTTVEMLVGAFSIGNLTFSVSKDLSPRTPGKVTCLLVGINRYQGGQNLAGALSDVERTKQMLERLREACVEWVYLPSLFDELATRSAITGSLIRMVEDALPGNTIVFYFSGRGTTVPLEPKANAPPGTLATALCPSDAVSEGVMTAVEVKDLLMPALLNGVTVVLVLDCSFRAGPADDPHHRVVKYLPLPNPGPNFRAEHIVDFGWIADQACQETVCIDCIQNRSLDCGLPESVSVGSVLDTLRVGTVQAFGEGIVEAAKKASATRDVAPDHTALSALEAMSREQWARVARQAIELDPLGMCSVVDGVAGGLESSPARLQKLVRELSDSSLISALASSSATAQRGLGEQREVSLELSVGGDQERLRSLLWGLPYHRKLQLLDRGTPLEVGRGIAEHESEREPTPWVTLSAAINMLREDSQQLQPRIEERLDRFCYANPALHVDKSQIEDCTASMQTLQWLELLKAIVHDYPVALQAVGDVLGRVLGRVVGTEEISDAEGEGLAQLVAEIEVVPRTSDKAEAGRALWLPSDGCLWDLDSVHAFATVRSVVDAFERALRGITGIEDEDCMQELVELDEGRGGGWSQANMGLRWQMGRTLLVDTRATGVAQPKYSRQAGALLFPARVDTSDGAAPGSASRAFDVVAHTAGYAVLDALRPAWAEGIKERPEGGVLHEAFADLTGLLAGLGTAAVGSAVATQTRCDVRAESMARRLQAGLADTLGLSSVRSACSTLTARDVWPLSPSTGEVHEGQSRRSSREVSTMITSAVWSAIAAELARRCHRATKDGGRSGLATTEDPAEVLSQLAKLALRSLVAACLRSGFKKEAPSLVEFCDSLVLWATLHRGAMEALETANDEQGAWESLVVTWGVVERMVAGQAFGDRRAWSAIVVEAPEERTCEGCRESVRKLVLSLEYVLGCWKESPSLSFWGLVLDTFANAN
eukprot:m51a1_g8668 hypothetical protein (1056) ;mRNA; r:113474-118996